MAVSWLALQVKVMGDEADLLKLFVEPSALRRGVGRTLLAWATNVAREKGATRLINRFRPRCGSILSTNGSLRRGPSAVWFDTGEDVAKIGELPLPC
jgi:GNAT superfamily N-acetyltransferase